MSRTFGLAIGILVVTISLAARGTDISYPSLEELVRTSDRVARVEIVQQSVARVSMDGQSHECGVIFTARVLESLKGGGETFRFLASSDRDFIGTDADYLIFAVSTSALPRPSESEMPERELMNVKCRLEAAPYLLSESVQTMIPFVEGPPDATNGEWLRISRMSAISTLPVTTAHGQGQPVGLVRWAVAKKAIMHAVAADPRLVSMANRCD